MKNGLLEPASLLLSQASKYGALSAQIALQAGLSCLEESSQDKQSAYLLKRIKMLGYWLAFPKALSQELKDNLRGASWSVLDDQADQPGWRLHFGTEQILRNPASSLAVVTAFAWVLTHWERNDKPQLLLTFQVFLARLLYCHDDQKDRVRTQLHRAANELVLLNKEAYPDVEKELNKVLALSPTKGE